MTNKERFIELLRSTKREGIEKLIDFLEKTDFFTAPASTRFHMSCEGGLLQHSLNVYDCLVNLGTTTGDVQEFQAAEKYPLVLFTHMADQMATSYLETNTGNKKPEDIYLGTEPAAQDPEEFAEAEPI